MNYYWWQRMATSIVHAGHQAYAEYEVCNTPDGRQFYTGKSRMGYYE